MDRPKTERLLALLRAQRHEASQRSALPRDSAEWSDSSGRLDDLNDRIMHVGAFGTDAYDVIGDGVDLDLDCRPVGDQPFRRHVVAAVRHAFQVADKNRVALRAMDRLAASADRRRRTGDLIRRAEDALQLIYPNASLAQEPSNAEPDTIVLRADREGRFA